MGAAGGAWSTMYGLANDPALPMASVAVTRTWYEPVATAATFHTAVRAEPAAIVVQVWPSADQANAYWVTPTLSVSVACRAISCPHRVPAAGVKAVTTGAVESASGAAETSFDTGLSLPTWSNTVTR